MKTFAFFLLTFLTTQLAAFHSFTQEVKAADRPNIMFCIADDWGWPHAGSYGDPVVKTPAFDRIAREGILFENAFVTSPSCTPCRNSILTGQYHWRLEHGGNLWSSLHPKYAVFPELLEQAGYHIGHWRKAWGPGNYKYLGRTKDPAGPAFKGLADFLSKRPANKPFCFWLGASDPHRGYKWQSGAQSGIDINKIQLPADLPDSEIVRHDVADYYFEVQRFDNDVANALKLLQDANELENTIIVMTGDHGMPFPRHKCHLYDSGTRVCLALRWGENVKAGRRVSDFVSLADLAPTFLEAAGVDIPTAMTGRSLAKVLHSTADGRIDESRGQVFTGRERHTVAQGKGTGGYPMRAIRTDDFLYIKNFLPDRWPTGVGPTFRDCDGSPSKTFIIENKDDPKVRPYYDLAFARRPAAELYDLKNDPDQLVNVADMPKYADTLKRLDSHLQKELKDTADPRVLGGGEKFDQYPYRPSGILQKK